MEEIFQEIKNNNIEYIEEHVNQNNINQMFYGDTPLIMAVTTGRSEIVEILIEKGADIVKSNINKYTPLIQASYHGRTKIVKLLLKQKCDVNNNNTDYGRSALNYSAWGENREQKIPIAKMLLSHGADPFLKDKYGDSFLKYVNKRWEKADQLIIKRYIEKYDTPVSYTHLTLPTCIKK